MGEAGLAVDGVRGLVSIGCLRDHRIVAQGQIPEIGDNRPIREGHVIGNAEGLGGGAVEDGSVDAPQGFRIGDTIGPDGHVEIRVGVRGVGDDRDLGE